MKTIKLTQGYEALVDDDDYAELSKYRWNVARRSGGKPACVRKRVRQSYGTYENKTIGMHTFLMNPPPGLVVDHIDGNPLNNQRHNLRCVTSSRNSSNRICMNPHGYPGVYINNKKYWSSVIVIDRSRKYLGTFSTIEEAAKAYREAYLAAFGEEHRFYRNTK